MSKIDEIQHLFILYLACLLIFIGTFTSEWSVNRNFSKFKVTSGLLKACVNNRCTKIEKDESLTAMAIISCASAAICAVAMTVHYLMKKQANNVIGMLPSITLIVSIIGGALMLLTCAIFGYDKFGDDVYPGYSYILALIGAIFLITGGSTSSKK